MVKAKKIRILEAEYSGLKEQVLSLQSSMQRLSDENVELKAQIVELLNKQSKNSKNSSKPPSTDGFKRTMSMRKPSGRKPGGQMGHPGSNLPMVEVATRSEIHVVKQCSCCGKDISEMGVLSYKRRQVTDVPPIIIEVIEHMAEQKECPHCKTVSTAAFPERVSQPMQYGDNIRLLVVYMLNFLMVSVGRTARFLQDFTGIRMSEGTIINIQQECAANLSEFEEQIKEVLRQQKVLHFDETGYRIGGILHWLHSVSTKKLTLYVPHEKRGQLAMDAIGILPEYKGIAVHDYWKSYMEYTCDHSLCNAHHLRDLTFCFQQEKSNWAMLMIGLLLNIKDAVAAAKSKNVLCLEAGQIQAFEQQYTLLNIAGRKEHPLAAKEAGRRGKQKQTKSRNMLQRFEEQCKCVLAFMYDFNIPFDNNLAEQDIRMTKTKLKVSGGFRSMGGAVAFARIRSYISTIRKQGQSLIDALLSAIKGDAIMTDISNYPSVLSG